MEKNGNLTQALKDINKVTNNTSWFRDTPHRWATASLPLAYAYLSDRLGKASCLFAKLATLVYNVYISFGLGYCRLLIIPRESISSIG